MITFRFPMFRMTWDPQTGECYTLYRDGTRSGCGVVDGDQFHGDALGITPEQHRLQHELAHHLVGFAVYGFDGSPIVWRDAQGISQDDGGDYKPGWSEAAREEWICNALQYHAKGKQYEDGGALRHARESGVDVDTVAAQLETLLTLATKMAPFASEVSIQVEPEQVR